MLPKIVYHQGPPDLEAWFKKLFSKLVPQKRPKLKDLQPPEPQGFNTWYAIIPFVLVVSVLLSGIITVKSGEAVVVTRFGVYQNTLMPGTHWTVPVLDHHISVDVQDAQQVNISGLMLTQDQYLVNANIILNYKVIDPKAYVFASSNADTVMAAYLQAASMQVIQNQLIANLLNKDNFATFARLIQNNLTQDMRAYGVQIQSVSVVNMGVPDVLSNQFMQTVNQAQRQVSAMTQSAEAYKAALAPIAVRRAQEIGAMANLKRVAVVVAAEANVAEFNALLPLYQKDPEATAAYLPLLLETNVKNLAPQTNPSPNPGVANASSAQNAYNRWQSANQSQANAQQNQNQ